MAFLAGTHGNTSDEDKLSKTNCDVKNGKSFNQGTFSKIPQTNKNNGIVKESGSKSAFKKVIQQQAILIPSIAQTGTINGRNMGPFMPVDMDTTKEDEQKSWKTKNNNNTSDNHNSQMIDKDNESNCLIRPKGDIPSTEYKVT